MSEVEAPVRPTPELHHKHAIVIDENDWRLRPGDHPARVETQTQLDRYLRRRSISEDMHEAGCRYFADAYYSGTVPHGTGSYGERLDRSAEAFGERYVAARERRKHAIRALGALFAIAEYVCVDDHAAEGYAIRRKEHPRAGIAMLRLALEVLTKHYGLTHSKAA